MWCIALLINSCTWQEFKYVWGLICVVFLRIHLGQEHANHEHQDALLDKIQKVKSDSDTFNAVKSINSYDYKNTEESCIEDIYEFSDDEYDDVGAIDGPLSRRNKKKV